MYLYVLQNNYGPLVIDTGDNEEQWSTCPERFTENTVAETSVLTARDGAMVLQPVTEGRNEDWQTAQPDSPMDKDTLNSHVPSTESHDKNHTSPVDINKDNSDTDSDFDVIITGETKGRSARKSPVVSQVPVESDPCPRRPPISSVCSMVGEASMEVASVRMETMTGINIDMQSDGGHVGVTSSGRNTGVTSTGGSENTRTEGGATSTAEAPQNVITQIILQNPNIRPLRPYGPRTRPEPTFPGTQQNTRLISILQEHPVHNMSSMQRTQPIILRKILPRPGTTSPQTHIRPQLIPAAQTPSASQNVLNPIRSSLRACATFNGMSICGFKTESLTAMCEHIVNNHYQCCDCGFLLNDAASAGEHYQLHSDACISCFWCNITANNLNSLLVHDASKHPYIVLKDWLRDSQPQDPKYGCKICYKLLYNDDQLRLHLLTPSHKSDPKIKPPWLTKLYRSISFEMLHGLKHPGSAVTSTKVARVAKRSSMTTDDSTNVRSTELVRFLSMPNELESTVHGSIETCTGSSADVETVATPNMGSYSDEIVHDVTDSTQKSICSISPTSKEASVENQNVHSLSPRAKEAHGRQASLSPGRLAAYRISSSLCPRNTTVNRRSSSLSPRYITVDRLPNMLHHRDMTVQSPSVPTPTNTTVHRRSSSLSPRDGTVHKRPSSVSPRDMMAHSRPSSLSPRAMEVDRGSISFIPRNTSVNRRKSLLSPKEIENDEDHHSPSRQYPGCSAEQVEQPSASSTSDQRHRVAYAYSESLDALTIRISTKPTPLKHSSFQSAFSQFANEESEKEKQTRPKRQKTAVNYFEDVETSGDDSDETVVHYRLRGQQWHRRGHLNKGEWEKVRKVSSGFESEDGDEPMAPQSPMSPTSPASSVSSKSSLEKGNCGYRYGEDSIHRLERGSAIPCPHIRVMVTKLRLDESLFDAPHLKKPRRVKRKGSIEYDSLATTRISKYDCGRNYNITSKVAMGGIPCPSVKVIFDKLHLDGTRVNVKEFQNGKYVKDLVKSKDQCIKGKESANDNTVEVNTHPNDTTNTIVSVINTGQSAGVMETENTKEIESVKTVVSVISSDQDANVNQTENIKETESVKTVVSVVNAHQSASCNETVSSKESESAKNVVSVIMSDQDASVKETENIKENETVKTVVSVVNADQSASGSETENTKETESAKNVVSVIMSDQVASVKETESTKETESDKQADSNKATTLGGKSTNKVAGIVNKTMEHTNAAANDDVASCELTDSLTTPNDVMTMTEIRTCMTGAAQAVSVSEIAPATDDAPIRSSQVEIPNTADVHVTSSQVETALPSAETSSGDGSPTTDATDDVPSDALTTSGVDGIPSNTSTIGVKDGVPVDSTNTDTINDLSALFPATGAVDDVDIPTTGTIDDVPSNASTTCVKGDVASDAPTTGVVDNVPSNTPPTSVPDDIHLDVPITGTLDDVPFHAPMTGPIDDIPAHSTGTGNVDYVSVDVPTIVDDIGAPTTHPVNDILADSTANNSPATGSLDDVDAPNISAVDDIATPITCTIDDLRSDAPTTGVIDDVDATRGPKDDVPSDSRTTGVIDDVDATTGPKDDVPSDSRTTGVIDIDATTGPKDDVTSDSRTTGVIDDVDPTTGTKDDVPSDSRTTGVIDDVDATSDPKDDVPSDSRTTGVIDDVDAVTTGTKDDVPSDSRTTGVIDDVDAPPSGAIHDVHVDASSAGAIPTTSTVDGVDVPTTGGIDDVNDPTTGGEDGIDAPTTDSIDDIPAADVIEDILADLPATGVINDVSATGTIDDSAFVIPVSSSTTETPVVSSSATTIDQPVKGFHSGIASTTNTTNTCADVCYSTIACSEKPACLDLAVSLQSSEISVRTTRSRVKHVTDSTEKFGKFITKGCASNSRSSSIKSDQKHELGTLEHTTEHSTEKYVTTKEASDTTKEKKKPVAKQMTDKKVAKHGNIVADIVISENVRTTRNRNRIAESMTKSVTSERQAADTSSTEKRITRNMEKIETAEKLDTALTKASRGKGATAASAQHVRNKHTQKSETGDSNEEKRVTRSRGESVVSECTDGQMATRGRERMATAEGLEQHTCSRQRMSSVDSHGDSDINAEKLASIRTRLRACKDKNDEVLVSDKESFVPATRRLREVVTDINPDKPGSTRNCLHAGRTKVVEGLNDDAEKHISTRSKRRVLRTETVYFDTAVETVSTRSRSRTENKAKMEVVDDSGTDGKERVSTRSKLRTGRTENKSRPDMVPDSDSDSDEPVFTRSRLRTLGTEIKSSAEMIHDSDTDADESVVTRIRLRTRRTEIKSGEEMVHNSDNDEPISSRSRLRTRTTENKSREEIVHNSDTGPVSTRNKLTIGRRDNKSGAEMVHDSNTDTDADAGEPVSFRSSLRTRITDKTSGLGICGESDPDHSVFTRIKLRTKRMENKSGEEMVHDSDNDEPISTRSRLRTQKIEHHSRAEMIHDLDEHVSADEPVSARSRLRTRGTENKCRAEMIPDSDIDVDESVSTRSRLKTQRTENNSRVEMVNDSNTDNDADEPVSTRSRLRTRRSLNESRMEPVDDLKNVEKSVSRSRQKRLGTDIQEGSDAQVNKSISITSKLDVQRMETADDSDTNVEKPVTTRSRLMALRGESLEGSDASLERQMRSKIRLGKDIETSDLFIEKSQSSPTKTRRGLRTVQVDSTYVLDVDVEKPVITRSRTWQTNIMEASHSDQQRIIGTKRRQPAEARSVAEDQIENEPVSQKRCVRSQSTDDTLTRREKRKLLGKTRKSKANKSALPVAKFSPTIPIVMPEEDKVKEKDMSQMAMLPRTTWTTQTKTQVNRCLFFLLKINILETFLYF